MTHAYKPSWNELAGLPVTDEQRVLPVSGVLPSGEHGGFDYDQHQDIRVESPVSEGYGINYPYPYPNTSTEEEHAYASGEDPTAIADKFSIEWWEDNELIDTYPPNEGDGLYNNQKSIFHYNGDVSSFSNGPDVSGNQISNFKIFNAYFHHEYLNDQGIEIPYLSTYKVSVNINPYG